jgi:hypothetical protein
MAHPNLMYGPRDRGGTGKPPVIDAEFVDLSDEEVRRKAAEFATEARILGTPLPSKKRKKGDGK